MNRESTKIIWIVYYRFGFRRQLNSPELLNKAWYTANRKEIARIPDIIVPKALNKVNW